MPAVPGAMLAYAVLAVALVGVSFGSIFARLADAPALAIALWRMTFAALLVLPAGAALMSRRPEARSRRGLALACAAGCLLAVHFATWITSLEHTSVANSVLLVNTAPVWVALIAVAGGAERPQGRTWLAVLLALAGALVIGAGGFSTPGSTYGNLLALAGAMAMGGYLVLARAAQRQLPFLPYVSVAYGIAALALALTVWLSATPWRGFTAASWLAIGGMALVSQLVGHSGYNWSLRHLPPVFVAIALTGEPVLAGLLAWWLLAEPVTGWTWLGGAFVLAGIATAATRRSR